MTWSLGMLLLATVARAQAPPPPMPSRHRPSIPQVGTAAIKGRVVDAQTGMPVSRARVRLSRMGGGEQPSPSFLTDQSGAFAFTALPAGSYSISVDKTTYLTGRYPDDGQTLRTRMRPLTVIDGQAVDGITVKLSRGGAIAGRVLDAHGDPVEFASIHAMKLPSSGKGRPQQRGGASSNDLGEFRLAHLEPGKYVIFAMPRRDTMVNGPTGRGERAEPVESLPAPTFYPGVQTVDQAQAITLERGASVIGLDVTLVDAPSALVSGTASKKPPLSG